MAQAHARDVPPLARDAQSSARNVQLPARNAPVSKEALHLTMDVKVLERI
jgi:hypothetical protein